MNKKWIKRVIFTFFLMVIAFVDAQEAGVTTSQAPPIEITQEKAMDGDLSAQIFLGAFYENHKDYPNAAKWYRKAAEQNHPLSQYRLGELYDKGQGVSQDNIEAFKWIKLSLLHLDAEQKDSVSFQMSVEKKLKDLKGRMTEKQLSKAEGLVNIFLREKK